MVYLCVHKDVKGQMVYRYKLSENVDMNLVIASLKNKNGWGNIIHFRVQINLKKPDSINILETRRDDKTDPNVGFAFNAKDSGSGIDHYEINIEDKVYTVWENDGTSQIFVNPIIKNGQHVLYIKAFDKAGNFLDKTVEFNIEPLNLPEIINYKKELKTSEIISISGKTYLNSDISFWIQHL